ncbi:MAG: hypothetical protein V4730_11980 [Pseudomonadota bacterium]
MNTLPQPSPSVEAAVQRLMKLADVMAKLETAATIAADASDPRRPEYVAADNAHLAARREFESALRAELASPLVAPVGDAPGLADDAVIDLVKEAGLDWHAGFNLDDENRYGTLVRLSFNLGAAILASTKGAA